MVASSVVGGGCLAWSARSLLAHPTPDRNTGSAPSAQTTTSTPATPSSASFRTSTLRLYTYDPLSPLGPTPSVPTVIRPLWKVEEARAAHAGAILTKVQWDLSGEVLASGDSQGRIALWMQKDCINDWRRITTLSLPSQPLGMVWFMADRPYHIAPDGALKRAPLLGPRNPLGRLALAVVTQTSLHLILQTDVDTFSLRSTPLPLPAGWIPSLSGADISLASDGLLIAATLTIQGESGVRLLVWRVHIGVGEDGDVLVQPSLLDPLDIPGHPSHVESAPTPISPSATPSPPSSHRGECRGVRIIRPAETEGERILSIWYHGEGGPGSRLLAHAIPPPPSDASSEDLLAETPEAEILLLPGRQVTCISHSVSRIGLGYADGGVEVRSWGCLETCEYADAVSEDRVIDVTFSPHGTHPAAMMGGDVTSIIPLSPAPGLLDGLGTQLVESIINDRDVEDLLPFAPSPSDDAAFRSVLRRIEAILQRGGSPEWPEWRDRLTIGLCRDIPPAPHITPIYRCALTRLHLRAALDAFNTLLPRPPGATLPQAAPDYLIMTPSHSAGADGEGTVVSVAPAAHPSGSGSGSGTHGSGSGSTHPAHKVDEMTELILGEWITWMLEVAGLILRDLHTLLHQRCLPSPPSSAHPGEGRDPGLATLLFEPDTRVLFLDLAVRALGIVERTARRAETLPLPHPDHIPGEEDPASHGSAVSGIMSDFISLPFRRQRLLHIAQEGDIPLDAWLRFLEGIPEALVPPPQVGAPVLPNGTSPEPIPADEHMEKVITGEEKVETEAETDGKKDKDGDVEMEGISGKDKASPTTTPDENNPRAEDTDGGVVLLTEDLTGDVTKTKDQDSIRARHAHSFPALKTLLRSTVPAASTVSLHTRTLGLATAGFHNAPHTPHSTGAWRNKGMEGRMRMRRRILGVGDIIRRGRIIGTGDTRRCCRCGGASAKESGGGEGWWKRYERACLCGGRWVRLGLLH